MGSSGHMCSRKLGISPACASDGRKGCQGINTSTDLRLSSLSSALGWIPFTPVVLLAVKTCESDMTGSDEEKHCTPRDTEVTVEEHELPHVDDVVPEVESTNQEREETEVGIPGCLVPCGDVWVRDRVCWSYQRPAFLLSVCLLNTASQTHSCT